jgi:hypothetical protein
MRMIIFLIFLKEGRRSCFCRCVGKVKNAKKQTGKFQKGLLPSCKESKECKEKDKQITEGRCFCVGKVNNVKKRTDKFQWRDVAIV